MALTAVVAGQRAIVTDVNQFFNLLKGVSGSAETVTLLGDFAVGTTPATTGFIRIPNLGNIVARNAANSANIVVLGMNADNVTLDPSSNGVLIGSTGAVSAVTIQGTSTSLSMGPVPATAGVIRIPNQNYIYSRNQANNANLLLIGLNTVNETSIHDDYLGVGSNYLRIGITPATAGTIRIPNAGSISARNAANNADHVVVYLDSANRVNLGDATAFVDFRQAVVALGGGAAPTVGTIGGSGPAAAGQNSWMKVYINGTLSFLPVWR